VKELEKERVLEGSSSKRGLRSGIGLNLPLESPGPTTRELRVEELNSKWEDVTEKEQTNAVVLQEFQRKVEDEEH